MVKCKYCKEEMQDFTKSFICCFNKNCPHRKLPAEKREGAKSKGYCIEKTTGGLNTQLKSA